MRPRDSVQRTVVTFLFQQLSFHECSLHEVPLGKNGSGLFSMFLAAPAPASILPAVISIDVEKSLS